jgi:predicted dehydrogenase
MGREHIANLSFIDGATVTAIVDPNSDSRERAHTEVASRMPGAQVRSFTHHHELFESDLCDAVIIATPNFTHATVLKDALATDLHVFIEKPLCTTISDCIDVIEWADRRSERSDALVWMGLEYRYMPPVAELIKITDSGGVGNVHQVAIREHREPFYPKVDNWNRFTEKTGGTLVEKCCHYFNLMERIIGQSPTKVYASGGQRVNFLDESYAGKDADMLDSAFVVLDYPNGARAMLDLCMFAENTVDKEHISVVGDGGKVESFLPSLELRHGKRSSVGNFKEWTYDASKTKDLTIKKVWDDRIKYPGFHYGASYLEHLEFFHAMKEGHNPEVSLEEGMRSVAVGLAAHRSIETGRVVEISEVMPAKYSHLQVTR